MHSWRLAIEQVEAGCKAYRWVWTHAFSAKRIRSSSWFDTVVGAEKDAWEHDPGKG